MYGVVLVEHPSFLRITDLIVGKKPQTVGNKSRGEMRVLALLAGEDKKAISPLVAPRGRRRGEKDSAVPSMMEMSICGEVAALVSAGGRCGQMRGPLGAGAGAL